jgi:hypothetical protein
MLQQKRSLEPMEGTMAEATSGVNNGVNVAALIAAREALTNAPAAAQFRR